MKKKNVLVLSILIASFLVVPTAYSKKGGNPFNELWDAINNLILRVTGLEENYEDLLERVAILEGGGTVECDPSTHEYLDPVAGCEGGEELNLLGQEENTFEFSENYEVTYSILLYEAAHGPGVPPSPSDLELRCLLTCSDSLYSLTLYDSDCEVIEENTDYVSYSVEDDPLVHDSAELTLKVVYESGCPCSPWELTIETGPEF